MLLHLFHIFILDSVPDLGTRITIGVTVTFVLLVLAVLIYLKMTEKDNG